VTFLAASLSVQYHTTVRATVLPVTTRHAMHPSANNNTSSALGHQFQLSPAPPPSRLAWMVVVASWSQTDDVKKQHSGLRQIRMQIQATAVVYVHHDAEPVQGAVRVRLPPHKV
jgi:hypothetical protein